MAASPATSWKCLSDSSEGGTLQRVLFRRGRIRSHHTCGSQKASTNPEKNDFRALHEKEKGCNLSISLDPHQAKKLTHQRTELPGFDC